MTFRFHVVMDVDLLGSGLPARQRRGPFLHMAPSLKPDTSKTALDTHAHTHSSNTHTHIITHSLRGEKKETRGASDVPQVGPHR